MIEKFYDRKKDQIAPALQKLFRVRANKTPTSLAEAISLAQKYFLRPSGKERWELRDSFFFWHKRNTYLELFDELGLLKPIEPLNKEYKSILLLGSDTNDYIHRLNYLLSLNVKSEKVFLLTGERHLNKKEIQFIMDQGIKLQENRENFMMEALFPKEIQHTIVSCPNHADGGRVNTFDTLKKWIKEYGEPGKHLLISTQPYAYFQFALAKNITKHFEAEHTFDIAAPEKLKKKAQISLGLDSIARIIYELGEFEGVDRVK